MRSLYDSVRSYYRSGRQKQLAVVAIILPLLLIFQERCGKRIDLQEEHFQQKQNVVRKRTCNEKQFRTKYMY